MKKTKKQQQRVEVDVIHVPREMIAALAYRRFVERGCEHGHDVEDWLAAERILMEEAGRKQLGATALAS